MKKIKQLIAVALLAVSLTGCGILPKQVEFFQRKVQAVPVISDAAVEHQRQAAQYVAEEAKITQEAALSTKADPSVLLPIMETYKVAMALTESVGPPLEPYTADKPAQPIVDTLHHDQAKLNHKIENYAEHVDKDVGKKIEGTGFFQIGYFSYLVIIVVLVLLAYGALRIYGMVNPAVGLGVNTVTGVASSLLSKGVSELVAGGESFKNYIEASPLTADVKNYVQDLFVRAHTSAQSSDVQTVVNQLTASNQPGVVSAPPPVPAPVASVAPLNVAPTLLAPVVAAVAVAPHNAAPSE